MKNLLFIASFAILSSLNVSFAQDEKTAGIYYISFRMDEELVNEIEVSYNERKVLTGYSEKTAFPQALIDSIKISIEDAVSTVLTSDVSCVYKLNRKGDTITTLGMGGELENMPVDKKKSAMELHDVDQYVRVDINYQATGGTKIDLPDGKRSKVKPMLTFSVKAFDKEGNKTFDESVKLKEFAPLHSIERTTADGEITTRKSEVLYPEDIYQMLQQAIELFTTP